MVPRETGNNAYVKVWRDKQRVLRPVQTVNVLPQNMIKHVLGYNMPMFYRVAKRHKTS